MCVCVCVCFQWPFTFELKPRKHRAAFLFALQSVAFSQQTWLLLNPSWACGKELCKQVLHDAVYEQTDSLLGVLEQLAARKLTSELYYHFMMSHDGAQDVWELDFFNLSVSCVNFNDVEKEMMLIWTTGGFQLHRLHFLNVFWLFGPFSSPSHPSAAGVSMSFPC